MFCMKSYFKTELFFYFVVVACLAAVVLARSPTYAKNLESKTREIVDSIRTDAADDNEIEELKITFKSVFDSIKNQAAESDNNALQENEDLVMGNVKEDESVYLSGIIQKVKKSEKDNGRYIKNKRLQRYERREA
ncbi:unnamed protein product [Callosobruchus maculatus]|uniref:Uncharacterized protein n=1 Tax=Callosobruchus maculatus TaxID=64391 RepID=A0A653BL37_CALMS|nr:unnamed protein product [Callosobruchus maculatus]